MALTPTAQTGRNVRAEMARAGVSQIDLAERVGLSQSGLSKRLRGVVPFDVNELDSIATALGVPAVSLLPQPEAVAS